MRSERPEGSSRANWGMEARCRHAASRTVVAECSGTERTSPSASSFLLEQRQLQTEQDDLVLELDPELLERAAPPFDHECQCIGGGC